MMFFKSIRWRLLAWYGLILALLLGGFGFTAWHLEQANHFQQTDQELQRRVSVLTNALRAYHSPRPGNSPRIDLALSPSDAALFDGFDSKGFYYAIWLREKQPVALSPNAPASLARPEAGVSSPRQRGSFREAFLFAAPVDCILVGKSIEISLANQQRFAWLLAGAGCVVLVLGLAVGWWLVSHALSPVQAIGHTAARIANGDLSQRINVADTQSELGELATVLNATFGRLEGAFVQQTRFTSDAAHELRTPVAILLAQIQAAVKGEHEAEALLRTLQANQTVAQRMRQLIESLLELARFDAGHEPLNRQEYDLRQVAEDGLEVVQPLAMTKRISLHAHLQEAVCAVDPDHLAQVMTNLLTNAIEYSKEGGEVEVATCVKEGRCIISVSDHGCGISAEDLPHIFERFFRADPSRSQSRAHSGLGLAISKAIMEAHGGSLEVESKLGVGTTFRAVIPRSGLS